MDCRHNARQTSKLKAKNRSHVLGAKCWPHSPSPSFISFLVLLRTFHPLASTGRIFHVPLQFVSLSPDGPGSLAGPDHQWDVRKARCLLGGLFVLQLEARFVPELAWWCPSHSLSVSHCLSACPLCCRAVTRGLVLSVQDSSLSFLFHEGYFRVKLASEVVRSLQMSS